MSMVPRCGAVVAALAVGASCASAGVFSLFSQEREPSGFSGISVTEGGNPFGFADRRLADNFMLPSDSTVETVRWWGGNEANFAPNTELFNIEGFEVTFFSDDAGAPGAEITTEVIPLADANATEIAGETQGILGAPMYSFEADLASSLSLSGGERLWISIAADLINPVDATNEAFQWVSSVPGDGLVAQDRFDGEGFLPRDLSATNFAFELIGVPSPGASALFALAGVGGMRRRR